MKVVGIIPARYGSTRLPGKPLKDILGHPMIWWVYERVKSVEKLDEVFVATDDERIESACKEMEIPVVMTANTHRAAAHRLQEVSETIHADFYVQLNGDEPLINTEAIATAIPDYVPQDVEFGTNIITEITEYQKIDNRGNVTRKAEVLCTLAKRLEPYEKKLCSTEFKAICDDTTFLLNKVARHNLKESISVDKKFLDMNESEIEEWCDRAYKMFFGCMAVLPYIEYKSDIKGIKAL